MIAIHEKQSDHRKGLNDKAQGSFMHWNSILKLCRGLGTIEPSMTDTLE
jgi:hypothetical protein